METNELEIFIENFKSLLLSDENVNSKTDFKQLESWDSLFILELIMMIDEKYEKKITPTTILDSTTINDLFNEIKSI